MLIIDSQHNVSRWAAVRISRVALLAIVVAAALLTQMAGEARADREACGPTFCDGEDCTCCNYGCGICTGPGEGCILLFCSWGRPTSLSPEDVASTDIYDDARAGSRISFLDSQNSSQKAVSVFAQLQAYVRDDLAVRARAAGTRRIGDGTGQRSSWLASGGATYRLPNLGQLIGGALLLDGEYSDGPTLASTVGPAGFARQDAMSGAFGLALLDLWDAVPLHAHGRMVYVDERDVENAVLLDAGLGISFDAPASWPPVATYLQYVHQRSVLGRDFVSHRVGAGIAYRKRIRLATRRIGTLRVGVSFDHYRIRSDIEALNVSASTRINSIGLLADYFWGANY